MRYTLAKEKEVKKMVAEKKDVDYISAKTNIPKKVIWRWCPELRPKEDVLMQIIKQRFRLEYQDLEARIANAYSPFVKTDITDKEWIQISQTVFQVLFDESLLVFKSALNEPPQITNSKTFSNDKFLDFLKKFWSEDSEYVITKKLSKGYVKMNRDSIHYWSSLRKLKLTEVSKGDIEIVHEKLEKKGLSESRIISVLKTALIPLKFAFFKGLIAQNVSDYHLAKRPPKFSRFDAFTTSKIFNAKWDCFESRLANLIAYYTGFQLREVLALTLQDIYTDGYIVSSHICNADGYCVNSKPRCRKVPITLIDTLLQYTSTSPFKDFKATDFVFYSANRQQPTRNSRNWTKELRKVCLKNGIDVSQVEFSIWTKN